MKLSLRVNLVAAVVDLVAEMTAVLAVAGSAGLVAVMVVAGSAGLVAVMVVADLAGLVAVMAAEEVAEAFRADRVLAQLAQGRRPHLVTIRNCLSHKMV
jgi:hypothetical protein